MINEFRWYHGNIDFRPNKCLFLLGRFLYYDFLIRILIIIKGGIVMDDNKVDYSVTLNLPKTDLKMDYMKKY